MIKVNSKTNKGNIKKLIDIEIASINASLISQKAFSKQILLFLKNFIGNIDIENIFSNDINAFIANATVNLNKVNKNIELYNDLLEVLDNINFNISTLDFKKILIKINEYNKKYDTSTKLIFKSTAEIQSFIHSMSLIDISEYISVEDLDKAIQIEPKIAEDQVIKDPTPKARIRKSPTPLVENALVISEKDGYVTFPYTISELKKILKNNPTKYNSLSDIVHALYTKPLSSYRFSALSRFKEAYKLIIDKEKGTKKQALSLATELFSNYNLHPAIISACKNLNELDVYLSCLEYSELEDFHFFKIIYEAVPVVIKKKEVFE